MKIHILAADVEEAESLRVVADEVADAARASGVRSDFLLFPTGDDAVCVVTLSPRGARRLSSPRLCDAGRLSLMREVVEAVYAAGLEHGSERLH